jgi:tetratricopeptide (TPR) repeat protein
VRAAFLVWLAVFRRQPAREHLIEQLQRLGPAADAWDEILAEGRALAQELEAAHPVVAARVWHLVGTWAREHATSRDDAMHAFERAHRCDPAHRDALDDLAALLREDARWIDLVALLTERAAAEPDPQRRGELHAALGGLYDKHLGAPTDAIAWYEKARADEPESREVIEALHRLDRQTGAWTALAELLPVLIELHDPQTERARRVELHVELGGVLADHLGRTDDAVRAYNDALALEPRHPAAFKGLAAVYQATGQTDALLASSEAELDAAERAEQLQRYPELAEAWRARGRFDRATGCWEKLIALEPRSLAAHRGLAAALRGNEQWASLAHELRSQQ